MREFLKELASVFVKDMNDPLNPLNRPTRDSDGRKVKPSKVYLLIGCVVLFFFGIGLLSSLVLKLHIIFQIVYLFFCGLGGVLILFYIRPDTYGSISSAILRIKDVWKSKFK